MKKWLIAAGFLMVVAGAYSQNYQSAVGARLGYPLSASYKFFLDETNAIEAYAGFRGNSTYSWLSVSAAYQRHHPIEALEGLQYYYGAGLSAFFWQFDFDTDSPNLSLGLQGYLGLDYTFSEHPVNLTLDWVPTLFLNGYGSGFGAGYGSLGVRYVLSR